jgi:hypothetical protein
MTAPVTLDAGYFDAMYRDAADPWGFEDRWYEQRKCAISLALLPAGRYGRAFEPGCSIGVLTHLLAQRCGTLLSCDAAAVQAAAWRTRDLPQVLVEQRGIPSQVFLVPLRVVRVLRYDVKEVSHGQTRR